MKFVYASKDMAVSDSLKSRVEKKLSKLERYFQRPPRLRRARRRSSACRRPSCST